MDNKNNLTSEEQESFSKFITQAEEGEMAQVKDLSENCHNAFQFAKTHSVYVKDWEETKERMENNFAKDVFPPGVSKNLYRAIIDATDNLMKKKLEMVQQTFETKFGESIYNYLGPDGKTKRLFGIFG